MNQIEMYDPAKSPPLPDRGNPLLFRAEVVSEAAKIGFMNSLKPGNEAMQPGALSFLIFTNVEHAARVRQIVGESPVEIKEQ